jgi:drug/metabolite transporter (DMT)-like permease
MAYGCLALSMAMVGSYVGLSRLLVAVIPVMLLAWWRFAVAAVLLLPWLRRGANEAALNRRDHALLFLQSLLGNFLFTLCALQGTWLTSALSAGVMFATIPAAVALLSRVFLREALSRRVAWAIALSVAGVACLAVARTPEGSTGVALSTEVAGQASRWWLGHALLMAAVVCEAAYVVIGKTLTARVGPRRITAIMNLWGLVLATPVGLWMALSFDYSRLDASLLMLLAYYAVAASVLTVWLWMKGLQGVPAQRAGVFTACLPLSAAAIGIGWLGEVPTALHGVAGLMTLAGLFLATRPDRSPVIPGSPSAVPPSPAGAPPARERS